MASSAELSRDTNFEQYDYQGLPTTIAFRVAELLPGRLNDPINCRLHVVEWGQIPPYPHYEAISYTWGDPSLRVPVICDGKTVHITKNLHAAFVHFRYKDRSRYLWADGLWYMPDAIYGLLGLIKRRIYENAQRVQVWLGPDNDDLQANTAVQSIHAISHFLCLKLGVSLEKHTSEDDTYQELVLKNRHKLPLPDKTDFNSEAAWSSLVWFYSHKYFTRVWAIQEVSANRNREVNIGDFKTNWERVDLVACYLSLDSDFSDRYGFSGAYCWFAATIAELTRNPDRWLNLLYLTSNYSCMDARDVIYGLRGLMKLAEGGPLLDPDYSKSTEMVYRDCVEAALISFKKADVLLYVTGNESPSWIPRWEVPMLFQNPFRFGKPMPWKPAGDSAVTWIIDKHANILTLSGFSLGTIDFAESYNQLWFANTTIDSQDGKSMLKSSWTRILSTLGNSQQTLPLTQSILEAAAVSLSFGLNHKINPSEQLELLRHFVAYLIIALADDHGIISQYIPSDLVKDSEAYDGRDFGKPVWDFQYPDASIFVAKGNLVGCAVSTTQADDIVFVPYGSTYPIVLRPNGPDDPPVTYAIRGFSYVGGAMNGERADSETLTVRIC